MANRVLKCAECTATLYLPYPSETPVDFANPVLLTVEQMFLAEITCSRATCPSQGAIQDPFGHMAPPPPEVPQPAEVLQPHEVPQPSEKLGYIFTLNPDVNRHQQQAQVLEQLLANDPELNVSVHEGNPPCRCCVQSGRTCHGFEEGDRCRECVRAQRKHCIKSLHKVKPRGFWAKNVIFDYEAPCHIKASGLRPGPNSQVILQYLVKWPWMCYHAWQPAANLSQCPWVVGEFHLNNDPNFPGPPEWLAEYEELARLLAERRAAQGPGQM